MRVERQKPSTKTIIASKRHKAIKISNIDTNKSIIG